MHIVLLVESSGVVNLVHGRLLNPQEDKQKRHDSDETEDLWLGLKFSCLNVIFLPEMFMPAGHGQRAAQADFERHDQVSGASSSAFFLGMSSLSSSRFVSDRSR